MGKMVLTNKQDSKPLGPRVYTRIPNSPHIAVPDKTRFNRLNASLSSLFYQDSVLSTDLGNFTLSSVNSCSDIYYFDSKSSNYQTLFSTVLTVLNRVKLRPLGEDTTSRTTNSDQASLIRPGAGSGNNRHYSTSTKKFLVSNIWIIQNIDEE